MLGYLILGVLTPFFSFSSRTCILEHFVGNIWFRKITSCLPGLAQTMALYPSLFLCSWGLLGRAQMDSRYIQLRAHSHGSLRGTRMTIVHEDTKNLLNNQWTVYSVGWTGYAKHRALGSLFQRLRESALDLPCSTSLGIQAAVLILWG